MPMCYNNTMFHDIILALAAILCARIGCTTAPFSSKENVTLSCHNFETVFSFPLAKYIALFNRLKIYNLFGSALMVPSSGLLEYLGVVPHLTSVTTAYLGITSGVVLSIASVPLKNIIGFLYISKDNKMVKISAVDYWGRRKDRIVPVEDWIPLLDMEPKLIDAVYLSPNLNDGTKYKLFVKFGKVHNPIKMGQVLD